MKMYQREKEMQTYQNDSAKDNVSKSNKRL